MNRLHDTFPLCESGNGFQSRLNASPPSVRFVQLCVGVTVPVGFGLLLYLSRSTAVVNSSQALTRAIWNCVEDVKVLRVFEKTPLPLRSNFIPFKERSGRMGCIINFLYKNDTGTVPISGERTCVCSSGFYAFRLYVGITVPVFSLFSS